MSPRAHRPRLWHPKPRPPGSPRPAVRPSAHLGADRGGVQGAPGTRQLSAAGQHLWKRGVRWKPEPPPNSPGPPASPTHPGSKPPAEHGRRHLGPSPVSGTYDRRAGSKTGARDRGRDQIEAGAGVRRPGRGLAVGAGLLGRGGASRCGVSPSGGAGLLGRGGVRRNPAPTRGLASRGPGGRVSRLRSCDVGRTRIADFCLFPPCHLRCLHPVSQTEI